LSGTERQARRFDRWSGPTALAIVVALSVIALRTAQPPTPVPLTAPDTAFSSARAMAHVRAIADEPHPVGTPAHARAREYVVASLRSLGLQTEVQTATALLQRGTRVRAATVRNVVARIPGTRSTGAVALVSHYDSEVLTPGAADAASAVAAILEAARALRAGAPLANDVIVLITDAEEPGLLGAEAFVSEHPWARDVALVLNFEARGNSGPSYMFETGAWNGWRLRAFAGHDPHPVANSLSYEVYRRMPNDTDFTVFRRAGIVGLNFAFIDGAHTYHQSFDTPENLSEASLQHHGEHALALARHFGSVDLTATSGADAVWFNFPGLGLVVYPASWAIPLAVLVVALWAGALVWGLRSRRARVRDVVAGILLVPLALVLANRGAHLLMWHLYPLHAEHDLLQGRAQYVEGWYLLAVVALTWLPVAGLWTLARRWFHAGGVALGALLLPTALVLVAAVAAPGVSVVVQWPVLCAVASAYVLLGQGEAPAAGVRSLWWPAVLAVPTLLILVPVLYLLFVAMNIELAPYLAVIAGLTLVLVYPLIDRVRRPNWWWSLVSAVALCAAFVAAGLLSRGVSTARPAPTALLYAIDPDESVAFWASGMESGDEWTRRVLPGDGEWRTIERFLPGVREEFRTAAAPPVALPAPTVEILSDETVHGSRHVTLAIRSAIAAPYLRLRAADESRIRLQAVNGRALADSVGNGFDLDYLGAPDAGIRLDLVSSTPAAPIALELWEHRYELPSIGGLPGPRPATQFPVADYWSDRTIVRRRLVVGG
jgi:hypothetical protein